MAVLASPLIFRYVKSVCHNWLMAVVLSLNSLAAFITMKAGLVIKSLDHCPRTNGGQGLALQDPIRRSL